MVDYDKATGSTGVMKIRDLGTTIEFWIYAGSYTYDNQMYWSYSTPHGASGRLVYGFQGGAWRHIGSVNVTVSGNVTFHLEATGTSGLGGPTDHTVYINRASRPSPPGAPTFSELDYNSVRVQFADGANNGASIDNRELWYSTDPNNAAWIWKTALDANDEVVTGLTSGATYYFWAKTHNSQGWSDLGPRSQITTHRIPDAPAAPTLSGETQTAVYVTFSAPYNGGSTITEYQIGYSKSSSTSGMTLVDSDRSTTLDGLDVGDTYYVRARAKNYVGWSAWGAASSVTLEAGAYVKVGTQWKRAAPYVNVNGVWKLAKPYAKSGGVWKEGVS